MKVIFLSFLLISGLLFSKDNFVELAKKEINLQERVVGEPQNRTATIEIKLNDNFQASDYPDLWLGILISLYRPSGIYVHDTFTKFNYETLSKTPLLKLRLSYLPLNLYNTAIGFFADASYSKHEIALKTITGLDASNTNLHSIFSSLGIGFEKSFFKKNLFTGVNFGYTKVKLIQSSDMNAARFTNTQTAYLIAPSLKWIFISKLSLYLSYEYLNFAKTDLTPQIHNFFVGLFGALQ